MEKIGMKKYSDDGIRFNKSEPNLAIINVSPEVYGVFEMTGFTEMMTVEKTYPRINLDNCEFIAGDVLKVIDDVEEKPDFIVLDPPRDGIHPKALEKIINYGVPKMVYISCKPSSLARDIEILVAGGYRVERVKCVDMFPNTVHVETVCLLQRI